MRSFTAEVACYLLTCLIVILCRTATTITIAGHSGSLVVDAHPIRLSNTPSSHTQQQQQQQRRQLEINAALTSTGPALPSPTPTSTTTNTQKPLIQIIAPNVTLFAALDLPPSSPQPSSPSPPSSPAGGESDPGSSSTPLLLPTVSLTLEPSQIYHVNDTLIFGAGGSEPLTVMPMTMIMRIDACTLLFVYVYALFFLFCFV